VAVFPVQIINNTIPALSVQAADSGVPAITYEQIKQSLGRQVYKVNELYIYSENTSQLIGVIQYQRFDSNGRQTYSHIISTIDPYQGNNNATTVNLENLADNYILNGNSSFSTTVAPETFVQIKFWADRITNEFGKNLETFSEMEKIAGKPKFFDNYGNEISDIQNTNAEIKDGISPNQQLPTSNIPSSNTTVQSSGSGNEEPTICDNSILLGIIAIGLGTYIVVVDN
jgi:hypothetical protein